MAQWLQAGEIEEFDDELALAMYRLSQELLEAQGYQQYEISNFARLGAMLHQPQFFLRQCAGIGLYCIFHQFRRHQMVLHTSSIGEYGPFLCAVFSEGRFFAILNLLKARGEK